MTGFEGKVALVTGCGKELGIGRAAALRLAREGADVAVAGRCAEGDESSVIWRGLASTADEIRTLGRRAAAVAVDITDEARVDAMITRTVGELGRLDIVFNNAGAAGAMNLSYQLTPAQWRETIEVNLNGTFIVSRAAAKVMIKQKSGGCMINNSSWRGLAPAAFMAAYCVSKAAVVSLTEVMALELAPHRIRVNAICPGKIETDMERWGWDMKAKAFGKTIEKVKAEETAKVPLGRISMPDELAGLIAFLASDEGAYITGQAIPFTGGMPLVRV